MKERGGSCVGHELRASLDSKLHFFLKGDEEKFKILGIFEGLKVPLPKQKELRLLLIEDVLADAELIQYELRKSGLNFACRCVESKKGFLEALESFQPELIISDFSMPEFTAIDALHLLKEQKDPVPFLLVTGSQSEEVAADCIKEGACDYILKNSLKRLSAAVTSALAKHKAEIEKEKAESALRRSEEYYRSLIENSTDLITILNPRGKILYQSPASQRVLGYEPEALIKKDFFDFVLPSEAPLIREHLLCKIDKGSTATLEYKFKHANGQWIFVETVSKNLLHRPEVKGLVLNTRDISERKMAEDQIREQAALLNKAHDLIWVQDLDGRITFWNKSSERVYGWSEQEICGRKAEELLFEKDQENFRLAMHKTLEQGEWLCELMQIDRQGKNLLVDCRFSLVREKDGRPKSILVIGTDITERKRIQSHLLRSQRLESIGTLAGGIAHDLNNVLTPILMSIKMLKDECPQKSTKDLLETLEASAHRGASIVNQVLSFARGVDGERSPMHLRHSLDEVVKIARDTFPPIIQIRQNFRRESWAVMGDPTQLHQVFMNLCVNARDAMPNGGRLTLEMENVFVDENYARMQPDATPGPYVVVTVEDTGFGIAPGVIHQIFEPFFTTKAAGKGTGLGLSTALGIIKGHGGFINVYSEPGKGTRFKVHLPAAKNAGNIEARPQSQQIALGNNEMILVVDDELAIREIIKLTLEANRYRVLTANDGPEAVALFAQRHQEIHLAIIDLMMPYMDGSAAMRALKKIDPRVRFIAISGMMEQERIAQLSEIGDVAFLAKPFTTEQLLTSLQKSLRTPVSLIAA